MVKHKQNSKLRQEVGLSDLRFYAFHGFYPEEQILGNEFFVDVTLGFTPGKDAPASEDLDQTVNYETVYQIVKSEMAIPRKLLETVCEAMLGRLTSSFPFLDDAAIRIRKTNLPFGGDQATSCIRLIWNPKDQQC